MASIKLEGLDKYQKELESLDRNITGILKRGVYDGAAVVADAVRAAIGGLTTVSDFSGLKAYKRRTPTTLTEGQKAGLLSGLTLVEMQTSGSEVNTKLLFSGYNSVKTKKYPHGQPNIMIAASVESGTSATQKQPFMRSAANKAKARARAAMEATVTSDIERIMEG